MPIEKLEAASAALGAYLDVRVRWHGEDLDRLLDAAHAALVEATVAMLNRRGWASAVEVSFNHFGERGSIDVLAWHAASRTLLVVEVKSVVPDARATISTLDRKARLGNGIGRDRGWDALSVGRLLVIADSSTSRRRVRALERVFGTAYPNRGMAVRRWLAAPAGPLSGLQFLSSAHWDGTRRD
jgi:hypothetical protein